jgi:hypothetical protein
VKAFTIATLLVICVFGGAIFSTFVTVAAWNVQIEPRAFQCCDGGIFGTYWDDIDEHRGAGDKISPGWTWDGIKTAREVYIGAFYVIWAAGSLISFRLILRRFKLPNRPLQPTPR